MRDVTLKSARITSGLVYGKLPGALDEQQGFVYPSHSWRAVPPCRWERRDSVGKKETGLGVGSTCTFFGWPSPISLAQKFFEFSWSTGYKNTFILKIGWNFAWLSTFSRQKVKIWHFKGKIYLNLISNLNFSPVFTPNACLCLLLQFDTKISKYKWLIAKKIASRTLILKYSTFLRYIFNFFYKKC